MSQLQKITDEQMDAVGVVSAPDVLTGTPSENKNVFDKMVRQLIAPAYNRAVDAIDAINQTESGIQAAEAVRVAAENGRVQAESSRAAAETQRSQAEQARTERESDREAAEQLRSTQETARVQAENRREDQETGYIAQAKDGALSAKSWAVGGTGTRPGEDTNNAEYWAGQAAAAAGGGVISFNGRTGSVLPQEGDYNPHIVGARPSRNLADNAYFAGGGDPGNFPINQKGLKTYNPSSSGTKLFDRWLLNSGTVVIESDCIDLQGLGIIIQRYAEFDIRQGEYTFSWLDTDGNMYSTLVTGTYTVAGALKVTHDNTNQLYVRFEQPSTKVVAIGLDAGTEQRQFYQGADGKWRPIELPNYWEMLAQCLLQLYIPATGIAATYYSAVINPTSGDIFFPVILPVPMRATPVITVTQATLYVGNEQKTVTPSAVTCYGLRGNQAMCRANGVAVGASARTGIVEIGGLQLSAEL